MNSAKIKICLLSEDPEFQRLTRSIFAANSQFGLDVLNGPLSTQDEALDFAGVKLVILDIGAGREDEILALQPLLARLGGLPPVLVVTNAFDAQTGRALLQMRVADFLVKPVTAVELMRACARIAQNVPIPDATDASIYTFLPASGGAGVTTLAIQTAMLLLNSRSARARPSTCLVDLDFQQGAVADYLDVDARLNLSEIEPRPDRFDRQLLEVMLSHHASGLAIVAAPNRPAEMRSFDPDVVTRLLDMVSRHFEFVVFDTPRTWFSWTDNVLLGSDHLYIVTESTVPGLRHARQLVAAIKERMGEKTHPRVIVNRFQQSLFSSGLRQADLEQALGPAFLATIPNDYALVREAIDRGVPLEEVKRGNKISQQLKKLLMPQAGKPHADTPNPLVKKLGLLPAR